MPWKKSYDPPRQHIWRRKWQPTPVLLPGKSHGQRRLVSYSSWGLKESDMTKQLTLLLLLTPTLFFIFFFFSKVCSLSYSSATLRTIFPNKMTHYFFFGKQRHPSSQGELEDHLLDFLPTLWSFIKLFATPWTVACQAPLSMWCCRQVYWSRLQFLSPEDLPDPGIQPGSPALQVDFLLLKPQGIPHNIYNSLKNK